jgi:alkanesulfonate monooxygenase SsuD/methylene tetrahydromethanopterin reductase-like flavin-dependent oxidoreductase (luciferase family)
LKFGAGPEKETPNEIRLFHPSDHRYENNSRTANDFIADIIDEAVYAEEVGLHSAWIGEHHFSTLGVLSCADLVLANVAARTRHLRLAPAVTVPPQQIRSASPSNGRP